LLLFSQCEFFHIYNTVILSLLSATVYRLFSGQKPIKQPIYGLTIVLIVFISTFLKYGEFMTKILCL